MRLLLKRVYKFKRGGLQKANADAAANIKTFRRL